MGIKERHERERETVRKAILDAATDLFTSDGYRQVSMRKIAERIEYSPAALYSYFPSKDDIFFALAQEGFERLTELGRQTPLGPTPIDSLRSLLLTLYRFSVQSPEHFALMFLDRSVPRIRQHYERFPHLVEMRNWMAGIIVDCVHAGQLPVGTPPLAVLKLLLNAAVGAAATRLCNRLGPAEDGEAFAHDAIELTLAGLRSGVPLTFEAFPPETDPAPGAGHAGRQVPQEAHQ
jgi:AcrR family transcriptional regulator